MKSTTTIAALAFTLFATNAVLAQKKEKEVKYERIFYKDLKKETDDVIISVDNAVSNDAETKIKLKITNRTADYIIYKPEESKFVINGKEMSPKEKMLIIKPNESDFRVINLKGTDFNNVKSYSFIVDGLSKVSPEGTVLPAADFKLPASQNDFKAGDFTCTLGNLSKETDKTEAKFKVVYNGNKIGFVKPGKAAAKMPDGNEFANAKNSSSPIMLMKGQDDSFTCKWERMQGGKATDMQKVDMLVLWRETFSESAAVKIKAETIQLEFDEALSNEKGKK